jgi:hypothetical protein
METYITRIDYLNKGNNHIVNSKEYLFESEESAKEYFCILLDRIKSSSSYSNLNIVYPDKCFTFESKYYKIGVDIFEKHIIAKEEVKKL